jgi:putative polyhydroxyalkanoate system protein
MPANRTIVLTIPHHLSQQEVRSRIQAAAGDFESRFASVAKLEQRWQGDRMDFAFTVMAQRVTGRVDVEPQAVRLEVELPWLLAALADQIRPQIEREGRRRLGYDPGAGS